MPAKSNTTKGSPFERSLGINILAGIGLSVLIVFLFLQTLNFWTNHGEYLRVPEVKGKTLGEATEFLEKMGFEIIIQDSIYQDTMPPLAVLKQFPEADATVKVNRTVYLTINRATPPLVDMPNLVGMSFRNAELELKAKGLKLGDTTYVPDIAKNAVKDQVMDGGSLRPGTKIPMGSVISLVLGAGIGSEEIPVPDLFGMPYIEALTLLEANGINLGVVLPDADLKDTTAGFVYWQNPARFNEERKLNRIRMGQMMDIRLSAIKPERPDTIPLPPSENQF
ncbi:MAG TPA: PASTA domain-containing protein [Chitinophagaceae bacterium]|nr:PASTA domain-containing protein [Chitinophagaceae bacterium]